MTDPIVEEVRRHRMEHTRKFHFDLAAICKDLKRIERISGHRVVRLPARKLADLGGAEKKLKPIRRRRT